MVNTCNTMLRKRLNQRWVPLEEDMAVLDAPQDSGFDLDETLGRLSPEHRAVVVLHYVEGYKVREIAGMLGIPTGTVKTRLMMARVHIQKNLVQLSAGRRRTQSWKKREYAEAVERCIPQTPPVFHQAMSRTLEAIAAQAPAQERAAEVRPALPTRRARAFALAALLTRDLVAVAATHWNLFDALSFLTGANPHQRRSGHAG